MTLYITDYEKDDKNMKRLGKKVFISVVALTLVAFLSITAHADDEKTIMGTVNENYQIVSTDGTVFEVADNDAGDKVIDLVGQMIKVTGTIEEHENTKTITITDYQIVQ